ncbi:MAG TPA: ferritin [Candidatus Acidoferrum sp.]|nr:ferritin [Candidatus Acidoferrum sp.]
MMISEKMAARLNDQVKHEFFSFWAYLAMAYSFETMGLKGFARRFYKQAEEEKGHATKIAKYLVDQGASVKLTALDQPKVTYSSAQEIIEAALEHEKKITKLIGEIASQAVAEGDHATHSFIEWFVDEQVEEVSTVSEILGWIKMTNSPGQLLMLEGRVENS